jgi:hypothetical protein
MRYIAQVIGLHEMVVALALRVAARGHPVVVNLLASSWIWVLSHENGEKEGD